MDFQLMIVRGRMLSILTGERIALNFMQRLSGVATQTRRHVDLVASQGKGDAGLRPDVLVSDILRRGQLPKDRFAPPVIIALVDQRVRCGACQRVWASPNRRGTLELERVLAFPDVLGEDGDAAPDTDTGERLAGQVEAWVRGLEIKLDVEIINFLDRFDGSLRLCGRSPWAGRWIFWRRR